MLDLDILAYGILATFYIFVIVPFFGDQAINRCGSTYPECWKVGAAIHLVLVVFGALLSAILWAFARVAW